MSTPLLAPGVLVPARRPLPAGRGISRRPGGERLLDLPDVVPLPDLARPGGPASWAEVRVAWNPGGLAVAFEVSTRPGRSPPSRRPARGLDGVQVWVDTRDTRNVHRATRFCHRFAATLVPGSGRAPGGRGRPEADRPGDRRRPDVPGPARSGPGRADPLGLAARAVLPGRGPPRLRPRDQPPARLRLSGDRPRPRATSSSGSAASSRSARTRASGRRWTLRRLIDASARRIPSDEPPTPTPRSLPSDRIRWPMSTRPTPTVRRRTPRSTPRWTRPPRRADRSPPSRGLVQAAVGRRPRRRARGRDGGLRRLGLRRQQPGRLPRDGPGRRHGPKRRPRPGDPPGPADGQGHRRPGQERLRRPRRQERGRRPGRAVRRATSPSPAT